MGVELGNEFRELKCKKNEGENSSICRKNVTRWIVLTAMWELTLCLLLMSYNASEFNNIGTLYTICVFNLTTYSRKRKLTCSVHTPLVQFDRILCKSLLPFFLCVFLSDSAYLGRFKDLQANHARGKLPSFCPPLIPFLFMFSHLCNTCLW